MLVHLKEKIDTFCDLAKAKRWFSNFLFLSWSLKFCVMIIPKSTHQCSVKEFEWEQKRKRGMFSVLNAICPNIFCSCTLLVRFFVDLIMVIMSELKNEIVQCVMCVVNAECLLTCTLVVVNKCKNIYSSDWFCTDYLVIVCFESLYFN